MENMENKMQTTELSPREEYHQEFLPQVHKIGATTMAIALILSLLPTVYFVFIKGIEVPLSTFISVMIAIFTFAIGMWLSEPAAFWPVLGSAGTYFAFLAGNASSMRLPVALTARSSIEGGDDLENPRTHVAMIIALFASVVVNLAILLSIVLIGDGLISILPASVLAAFNFVMPCLLANNILMQSKGPGRHHHQGVPQGAALSAHRCGGSAAGEECLYLPFQLWHSAGSGAVGAGGLWLLPAGSGCP